MMCEASTDLNMDELNHQRVNAAIADQVQVTPLSESVSVIESSNDGATVGASNDDNCKTLNTVACSDTISTSRPSDDLLQLNTEKISSSREEETGSMITSDVGGGKCNSTAPLIGYATESTNSFDEEHFGGGVFHEELNEADSPLRPSPSTVKSATVLETGDITTNTGPSSSSSEEKDVKQNIELQNKVAATATVERPNVATYMKQKVLQDDGELNERLKKRWGKLKQEIRAENSLPRHQQSSKLGTTIADSSNSDILPKYRSGSSSPERYPDDVSFGLEDEDGAVVTTYSSPIRTKQASYRKCLSDFGPNTYSSPRRRIGILQADGIVYDDALLIRLARQSRPEQHRRKGSATSKGDTVDPITGEEFPVLQTNEVKIHVYDLLTEDCMVEMPYLNCNFPMGRCFKAVNDGFNYIGTGAYHVGVEVNGVEYAYGGNNIQGMSGIFTCVPKESPGYDYRDTIDLGKLHTTKRTWVRIPEATNLSPLSQRMSRALTKLTGLSGDEKRVSEASQNAYTYREIKTFADGHTIIHQMTSDYLGVDYDLLRKNCCTFAHDACLRLGVNEEDIPSWFRNAALAGAQAEDTLINADNTVKNAFRCREDSLEAEDCSAGFEVIAKMERIDGSNTLKSLQVVESTPEHRLRNTLLSGIPIEEIDPEIAMRETASWA